MRAAFFLPSAEGPVPCLQTVGYVDRSYHDIFNRERQRMGTKKADLRWQKRNAWKPAKNEKKGVKRPQNNKS